MHWHFQWQKYAFSILTLKMLKLCQSKLCRRLGNDKERRIDEGRAVGLPEMAKKKTRWFATNWNSKNPIMCHGQTLLYVNLMLIDWFSAQCKTLHPPWLLVKNNQWGDVFDWQKAELWSYCYLLEADIFYSSYTTVTSQHYFFKLRYF